MDVIAVLIPGLLTGLAALIAALAALFRRGNNAQKNTEVTNDTVDVIEKIVDGQININKMLLERIQEQDNKIKAQDQLIARLKDLEDKR